MESNIEINVINPKEYEKQACRLLEEKYGESFEILHYGGWDWMSDSYKVVAYALEYPDILFEAEIKTDGTSMYDEYICARVCRKIEDLIETNIEDLPGYIQLKVLPLFKRVQSVDADMSVEEFFEQNQKNRYAVYLGYSPQIKDVKAVYGQIAGAFENLEFMSGNIQLYLMEEDKLKEMQTYLEENAKIYYAFEELMEEATNIVIPFEKGKIQITEEKFEEEAGDKV